MKMGAKLRGGICISLFGTGPKYEFLKHPVILNDQWSTAGTINVPIALQLRACFNSSIIREIEGTIHIFSLDQSNDNVLFPRAELE